MKTSFYFVLWILIYPLLGLFHNSFIDNNAFILAILLVWGLSYFLARMMPETLAYEHVAEAAPILEDVYTGNVASFKRRLSRNFNLESITAAYFVVSTIVIVSAVFRFGVGDWITLAIFAVLAFGAITRSIAWLKAKSRLKQNPTPDQCREIAEESFNLDYNSYYEQRSRVAYANVLPPKPKSYNVFRIVSIVMAVISALLGLYFIGLGVIIITASRNMLMGGAFAGMYLLYGSLAAYYGIKDFISCLH